MQGTTWMALLERIPANHHDGLGVVTSSGVEINIQSVMRMEEQYLVIRGRLMGSTDANRTFFVPYDQINCLIFQRLLREEEVQAWFGGAPQVAAPAAVAVQTHAVAAAPAAEGTAVPAEAGAAGDAAPAAAAAVAAEAVPITTKSGSIPLPGKAAILERLRRRTSVSAPGTIPKPSGPSGPGTVPKPPQ